MMSNTSSTTYGNCLQQHNLTAVDFLNQNGSPAMAVYPSVKSSESGLILDKETSVKYFTPAPNPPSFFSTQLVAQTPGTILITNNFGPDESSPIQSTNANFNNSSIRIVTHNNNTNNNNNNTKPDCNMNNDPKDQQHYQHLNHLHHQSSPIALHHSSPPIATPPNSVKMPNVIATAPTAVPTTTSTVVLDRINICINNHYGDASAMSPQSGARASPSSLPMIMSVGPHTTTVDTKITCVPTSHLLDTCSSDMHVDEPDSTTSMTHCHNDSMPTEQDKEYDKCIVIDMLTMPKFDIGEDALVKRRDGRYYLGTVVNVHRQQYLVQFDDKTDYWSNVDELMKLSNEVVHKDKPSCLSCKRDNKDDVVEICERCGRGYHRKCTDEVSPKSNQWMCKRCAKPMKWSAEDEANQKLEKTNTDESKKVVQQFPYALHSLTWDEKHRVNSERIYCYCGKSGQFDNNMIQCCKCRQWFHAHCVECVKTLFRGDVFFIFGCSVCNDGKEFLRRIEMEWVDLTHLILYNMAIMKNFQKYHHLHKEIYPFALEKRESLQLPAPILNLSDSDFKANLLKTLQANPKLFQCGKEIKKDHAFWGLRSNKPPQGPTYDIKPEEELCNLLIKEKLNIKILPNLEEMDRESQFEEPPTSLDKVTQNSNDKSVPMDDDDDDKFTSDDEIPIKLILEKSKSSTSTLDLSECNSDPINNVVIPVAKLNENTAEVKEKKVSKEEREEPKVVKHQQRNSRKRKAFTLSKGYKDSDNLKDIPRICDSSSDENSSSSRGTLDLIIPPPKNFLGINNPFRIVTPKKSDNAAETVPTKSNGNNSITKKTVSFSSGSIFSITVDLNSKIAAFKNSGLFPNISNSDIAKAAGQPRLVRTIKRRLSAKDIMIGPNQEVRRRRTKPLSSNVEVISTTTINPIPSNFFPIRAHITESVSTSTNSSKPTTSSSQSNSPHITTSTSSNFDCVPSASVTTHGRRLRKRPEKRSPQNSRRNSISSSSSSNSSNGLALPPPPTTQNAVPMSDLKQSVNRYFGAVNRIENGEKYTIRAKRKLATGQIQYLIEWES